MGSLNEYFGPSGSGYSIHRTFMRPERLPGCCRESLSECGLNIRYLGDSGEEIYFPLVRCRVCGRYYAVCGRKYMTVDNLMKYEIFSIGQTEGSSADY